MGYAIILHSILENI